LWELVSWKEIRTIILGRSEIRTKISQYLEKLSSAGHGDAEELTFYGLAYLRILHEEPDPRYTGCWVIRHVLVIAAFAIDAYAFSDRYADYAMQQGRLFSIPPTSELKNGKESREEVCKVDSEEAYPRRVHQSWRAWTARSLESANTRAEDCERNEAVGRFAAAEGNETWYPHRPSSLGYLLRRAFPHRCRCQSFGEASFNVCPLSQTDFLDTASSQRRLSV
jgi:hypothetical protein